MQGQPATILTSSLTFNYDLDPLDVLGKIQMPSAYSACDMCTSVSVGADDVSPSRDGKQLFVVLLPDSDSEERAFLEQGECQCNSV
jgi:hypothetical protein